MKRIFILLFLGAANLFAQSYVPGKLTVIVRDSAMQGIVRGMNAPLHYQTLTLSTLSVGTMA